jgi:hypothetical protein
MMLMGKANWWLPQPLERVLLIRRSEPVPAAGVPDHS